MCWFIWQHICCKKVQHWWDKWEIKLAVTLWIHGCGSYLDMYLLFDTSFNHMHKVFVYDVEKWFTHKSFQQINGIKYCLNGETSRMIEIEVQFSQGLRGILNSCIRQVDVWEE